MTKDELKLVYYILSLGNRERIQYFHQIGYNNRVHLSNVLEKYDKHMTLMHSDGVSSDMKEATDVISKIMAKA